MGAMIPVKCLAAAAASLAAACSYSETTATAPAPAPVATTTYYVPSPGTTVYTTAAPASRTTYVPAATRPPAGVEAFRDEYGFRYDGQGNRLDARGNIISPQSTRP
jgi:hypothetical protein